MKKVYIGRSGIAGRGVFANRHFERRETIFICKGRYVRRPYGSRRANKIGPNWLGAGKNLWLAPLRSNPLWWLNHSCEPNAGFEGKVRVVAMRSIKKGEEVTIDYSTTEEDPAWYMHCKCGNKTCRKIIGPVTSLSSSTFRKYRKFIAPYFRAVYQKAHRRTR